MKGSQNTEMEHLAAIARVLDFVQMHLDEDLSPRDLAGVACFSPHYFHRVFRAVVGESVMDHVRRLRLERAAYRLSHEETTVSEIALEAGYVAQEVFTRTFQSYFGVSPTTFRTSRLSHLLPAPTRSHYEGPGFTMAQLDRMIEPDLLLDACLCDAHRDSPPSLESLAHWADTVASIVFPPDYLEKITMLTTTDTDREIEKLEEEIRSAKARLAEKRRERPTEHVPNYELTDANGEKVRLSELFGDKPDLILIHNMGVGCVYCTMWADGFTGLVPHLTDRAAFVLVSPDTPEVQRKFAQKRNWNFRMISSHGLTFAKDMGFEGDKGVWPGVSVLKKDADGNITRVAKSYFEPGDDYCVAWSFIELIPEGVNGWEPKYSYHE